MTNLAPTSMRLLPVLALAGLLGTAAHTVHAQSAGAPSGITSSGGKPGDSTYLRSIPTVPTYQMGSTGSSSSTISPGISSGLAGSSSAQASNSANAHPGTAGCVNTVQTALGNNANYHYMQNYATHLNTVQQPQSFSECLHGIMDQAEDLDMFSDGFTFSTILKAFSKAAMKNIENSLEQAACSAVKNAANGVFGTITSTINSNVNQLSAAINGPIISLQATATSATNPMIQFSVPSISSMISGASGISSTGSSSTGSSSTGSSSTGTGSTFTGSGSTGNGAPTVCQDGTTVPYGSKCPTTKWTICPNGYRVPYGESCRNAGEIPD